jgi:uncharacterized radical SAM protein YgiQ
MNNFLPINKDEMRKRGWEYLDILLVSGDAYVDHPSFGIALIGRLLESKGFRVGIISQPKWHSNKDFLVFGRPKMFVGISAGCLDSMLANYSPNFRIRKTDVYSPLGKKCLRPNRACIVYTNKIKECFPGIPVILGGIEASLRRLGHYDWWSNTIRRSILLDAKADMIVYGMGESSVIEIAQLICKGTNINNIHNIRGTVWKTLDKKEVPDSAIFIPSFEEIKNDKQAFCEAFKYWYNQQNPLCSRPVAQMHGEQYIVQMQPSLPLKTKTLDEIYSLPFTRKAHPIYGKNNIPAIKSVETSITSHRGCAGGCSFCTLFAHQGRIIQSRAKESIIKEAYRIAQGTNFKGTISDIGGPTANMYGSYCKRNYQECRKNSCLYPSICKNFVINQNLHLELLEEVSKLKNIKHCFVSTGIRYDIVSNNYLYRLAKKHIGGHLKVAPEHISDNVLRVMRKPGFKKFEEFCAKFENIKKKIRKQIYIVPYFISGHPGCKTEDMVQLAEYLYHKGQFFEQVQDFVPLPMTLSSCIYWTGIDPLTGKDVYVPQKKEKQLQRALLQVSDIRNRETLFPFLKKIGKEYLLDKKTNKK